jgi:hypothetical protein
MAFKVTSCIVPPLLYKRHCPGVPPSQQRGASSLFVVGVESLASVGLEILDGRRELALLGTSTYRHEFRDQR